MAFFVSAVEAVIAVVADFSVAGALTAIADVGLATSVVGAVTGNKNLMKIGGEIGLVGGLGSMATSAFGAMSGAAAGSIDAGTAAFSDATGAAMGEGAAGSIDAGTAAFSDATGAALGEGAQTSALNPLADMGAQTSAVNAAPGMPDSSLAQIAPGSTPTALPATQPSIAPAAAPSGPPVIQSAMAPDSSLANVAPSVSPAAAPPMSSAPATAGQPDLAPVPGSAEPAPDPYANETAKFQRQSDAYNNNPATGGIMDKLSAQWDKFSPTTKAELLKAGMAIPGGIQTQNNKAKELALQQQKVNQTSYGSQVPTFGIINNARKG